MTAAADVWAGRHVLVTGATGMVGSWLVKDLLERGAVVVTLVVDADPKSELFRSGDVLHTNVVNGSLADYDVVERAVTKHEVDTVFHLGAQTIVGIAERSPRATLETNVQGTWNVLEACRLHRSTVERVVIASSDKAYGAQPVLPYDEDMPLIGRNPYDVSKSCADLIAQSYHHTYDLQVAIARCGNIFGGGDVNWSRIVPGTIRSFLNGERPVIRSDGTFLRDYVYVKDAVGAYLTLAEHMVPGAAFNFSTESPVTVLEIVAMLQKLMGAEDIEPDVRGNPHHEIRDQYLSAARAREQLGWRPKYDLELGLGETIEWYRAYLVAQ